MTKIVCGANSQELDGVAGKTLGEIKSQLADVLNIPSPVQAIVGGQNVNDDYVLKEDETVELVKPAGEKG
jgi:hypothetical protein